MPIAATSPASRGAAELEDAPRAARSWLSQISLRVVLDPAGLAEVLGELVLIRRDTTLSKTMVEEDPLIPP